jgi:hypothetical protein
LGGRVEEEWKARHAALAAASISGRVAGWKGRGMRSPVAGAVA